MEIQTTVQVLEDTDDTFTFEADGLTSDYVPTKVLESIYGQSLNEVIAYRHILPDGKNVSHALGRVRSAKLLDYEENGKKKKKIRLTIALDKRTNIQKNAVEYVRLGRLAGKPIGISAQFEQYGTDENPVGANLFEYSITPNPYCKECRDKEIGGNTMDIKEAEAKLTEMQHVLDESLVFKKKFEDLSKEHEDLKKTIKEQIASTTKIFEDKTTAIIAEVQTRNKKLEEEVGKLRGERDEAVKAPYKDIIRKYETNPVVLKTFESWSVEQLKEEADYLNSRIPVQPYTRSLDESRNIAMEDKVAKMMKERDDKLEKFFKELK